MRYVAVAALSSTAILAYLSRNAISVAESTIRTELDLTTEQSGWMMGAFFWSYAMLGIPAGWLGYKVGTRAMLAGCLVAWSAATALMGLAEVLPVLLAAQLLMGAAQAGLLPCTVKSAADWMPAARQAFACGCLAGGMQVGAILAAYLTGWLLLWITWREIFVLYALPGLFGAGAFYLLFRNHPAEARRVNDAELALILDEDAKATSSAGRGPRRTPWRQLARSRAVWFISLQQVFRAAGYMFFASWLPSFMQKTRGVSIKDSADMQAIILAAALAGSVLGGVWVDWVYRRSGSKTVSRLAVGSACMLLCGLLVLGAYFVVDALAATVLMALGVFSAAIGGPCALAAVIDVSGDHVPEVTAIMNSAGNLAVAATPVAVGVFFEWTEDWNLVLWGFAGIYIAAAASWLLVDVERPFNERRPEPLATHGGGVSDADLALPPHKR